MKFQRQKRKSFIRFFLMAVLAVSLVFFLQTQKKALVQEFKRFMETGLSRKMDLNIKIGEISGHLSGLILLKDVQVEEPWVPAGEDGTIFKAKEVQFRYRFLDFISKKFDSKVEVIVRQPEVAWRPHLGLRKPDFPFFHWFQEWALTQKNRIALRIENMTLIFGYDRRQIKGINLSFEDHSFRLEIPLSHIAVAGSDLSTVLNAEGTFEPGSFGRSAAFVGQIWTEGTVINWKPLAEESRFDFVFTEDDFRLISSHVLGGIGVAGWVDFVRDYEIDFLIRAEEYPMSHLEPFVSMDVDSRSKGRINMDLRFHGSAFAPMVEGHARISEGWITQRDVKAMDLNLSGIYPTVRLESSRLLLKDGSVMRLADKHLEINDLFRSKTYEKLIGEAQQDKVVWGDWEFSRPSDEKNRSEFLMQRIFGGNARVHFREFSRDEGVFNSAYESKQMEVGFEYRLRSKDSFKVKWKDDEGFVGVERKMKF